MELPPTYVEHDDLVTRRRAALAVARAYVGTATWWLALIIGSMLMLYTRRSSAR
jgi:hypothetical protein